MKKQQQFTNEILNALEHAKKAEANESFLVRMESIAINGIKKRKHLSQSSLLAIAASFTLLLTANIWMITTTKTNNSYDLQIVETTSTTYDIVPTKSLYNE